MSIYLYGAGGHAKVILDILHQQGRSVTALVADNPQSQLIHGIPVHDASILLPTLDLERSEWIIAIGHNAAREKIANQLIQQGFRFTTAIHPTAAIAIGVEIAPGSVVMANTVINTDTQIGRHVIINSGATVDHDCWISDFSHIAPGTSLCGQVRVGTGVLLGVGSSVCPSVEIGARTTCGAGSVIVKSLPANCTAYGCPAKVVMPSLVMK